MYQNFLLLVVAITMLSSATLFQDFCESAQKNLGKFIADFNKIYEAHNVTYNLHSLIHLPEQVSMFGPLPRFSGFPFVNYLQIIKRLVRRLQNPLQQCIRRLKEKSLPPIKSYSKQVFCKREHFSGPLPTMITREACTQYKQIHLLSYMLSTERPNNAIATTRGVNLVRNIIIFDNVRWLVCVRLKRSRPFFQDSIDSQKIDISVVGKLSTTVSLLAVTDIKAKMVLLLIGGNEYVSYALIQL